MRLTLLLVLTVSALPAAAPGETDFSASPHVKLKSVGMRDARWTEGFWADRVKQSLDVTLPDMLETINQRGNGAYFGNLRIAAGLEKGDFAGRNWSDGDVYKWIESAALAYALRPDAKLAAQMDEMIAVIAKAQQPDGYLSTNIQLTARKRLTEPRNHEVYNLGHLFTAAAIHFRATGKDTLLAVARKAADYLYGRFRSRPPELAHFSAPSNLMGIVELYRATREPRYLELARIFVEMRGTQTGGSDNFQDRLPLGKETEAVGHAVHATYLYATGADLYAETGDAPLLAALHRIWQDVTERKMYVTGAVGPVALGLSAKRDIVNEGFGRAYEIPNRQGYNETCANIGNAMWNRRMLALTGEARYADVMELVLYNSMLSGMSLDGTRWFYANVHRRFADELPLMRNESLQRWHATTDAEAPDSYCCPPNVLRTILKTAEWAYSISAGAVWVNLYGGGVLETAVPGAGPVKLEQRTEYPWSGSVRLSIQQSPAPEWTLMLRIPGWAESGVIKINGAAWNQPVRPGTYTALRRKWAAGDRVELELPMRARLVEANPYVEFARNQIAVMRGPVVYCLESPDLPAGVRVNEVQLPRSASFEPRRHPWLPDNIPALETDAVRRAQGDWSGLLYRALSQLGGEKIRVRLIPYFAWSNRGLSQMTVWMPLAD